MDRIMRLKTIKNAIYEEFQDAIKMEQLSEAEKLYESFRNIHNIISSYTATKIRNSGYGV